MDLSIHPFVLRFAQKVCQEDSPILILLGCNEDHDQKYPRLQMEASVKFPLEPLVLLPQVDCSNLRDLEEEFR